MAKEGIDIEARLLNSASLDELIKIKMEEELQNGLKKHMVNKEKKLYKEISQVPANLVFSKNSVFKLFNRINHMETYINGVQAEALLGLQNGLRERIKKGEIDAFSTDEAYVKFEKVEC